SGAVTVDASMVEGDDELVSRLAAGLLIIGIPAAPHELTADEIFQAWLQSEVAQRCLLLEAVYPDTGTGTLGTDSPATVPFVTKPGDTPANQSYAAIVRAIPQFNQSMSDVLIGRTTANLGNIEIVADASTDSWIFSRDWVGRALTLYIGDPSWPKSKFR